MVVLGSAENEIRRRCPGIRLTANSRRDARSRRLMMKLAMRGRLCATAAGANEQREATEEGEGDRRLGHGDERDTVAAGIVIETELIGPIREHAFVGDRIAAHAEDAAIP